MILLVTKKSKILAALCFNGGIVERVLIHPKYIGKDLTRPIYHSQIIRHPHKERLSDFMAWVETTTECMDVDPSDILIGNTVPDRIGYYTHDALPA